MRIFDGFVNKTVQMDLSESLNKSSNSFLFSTLTRDTGNGMRQMSMVINEEIGQG